MLEDKLRSTDWETTFDALEEAVARESYLSWLRENERRTLNTGRYESSTQVTIVFIHYNVFIETLLLIILCSITHLDKDLLHGCV